MIVGKRSRSAAMPLHLHAYLSLGAEKKMIASGRLQPSSHVSCDSARLKEPRRKSQFSGFGTRESRCNPCAARSEDGDELPLINDCW